MNLFETTRMSGSVKWFSQWLNRFNVACKATDKILYHFINFWKNTPNLQHCKIMFYLCEGWLGARGPLSGKQPWGLEHRSADWAYSGDGVLSATAPGMHSAGGLYTAGQRCYVQILELDKCMCCLLGSSDMPQPGTQKIKNRSRVISVFKRMKICLSN